MARAYNAGKITVRNVNTDAIQNARSPITWSPWSIRSDISPLVEGKVDRDSGPVPKRSSVRLPWQDVRHLSKFMFVKIGREKCDSIS